MNFTRINPNISSKDLSLLLLKCYTFKSPYKQYFSFPFDLMKYILKNPKSSNGLLKLYKTCKFFYLKNQVLIVSCYMTRDGRVFRRKILNNQPLNHIKKLNFWFINDLAIGKNFFFDLKKVYRCSLDKLLINTNLTFKEFQLLTSERKIKTFIFRDLARIQISVNQEATIADILQLLPNIKKFSYANAREKYSKEILKKMNSIKLNTKLEDIFFQIIKVSENFDATLLFQFILENAAQFCQINLLPFGENKETILLKLKAAEEKFKSLKEWNDKNFSLSFVLQ